MPPVQPGPVNRRPDDIRTPGERRASSSPDLSTVRGRVRFHLTPWWRLAWFLGAVLWCAAANVLIIAGSVDATWLGPLSVAPLLAFLGVAMWRARPRRPSRRDAQSS